LAAICSTLGAMEEPSHGQEAPMSGMLASPQHARTPIAHARPPITHTHQPIGSRRSQTASAPPPLSIEAGRELLGRCALFRDLGDDERSAFFARVRIRAYSAGEIIFRKGSAGDTMMVLLTGSVRISMPSAEGKEVVLVLLQPGEIFGEIAVLDGKERTADAKAVTPCHLAVLEQRDVLAILDRYPQIWPKVVEMLCDRLRNTDQHIADLALLKLPTRLAKVLLRIAGSDRGTAGGGRQTHVRLFQHELGQICGASRESVNKCLSVWQRRGIVNIDEGVVVVANRTALQEVAELDAS
jgi:CRP/FNR family cyclic AMP-dependent transcriptional regulator